MSAPQFLVVHAAPHPRPEVHRVGFELDDPYVEMCWVEAIGPTATLFLRRLPELWRQSEPAVFDVGELAKSMGIGHLDSGRRNKVWQTAERLTQFGLGAWGAGEGDLRVYSQVGPLGRRRLSRSSEATQAAHERILEAHLRRLAAGERQAGARGHSRPAGIAVPERRAGQSPAIGSRGTAAGVDGSPAGWAGPAVGGPAVGGPAGGLGGALGDGPGDGPSGVARRLSSVDRLVARLDAMQDPSINPPTLGR